MDYDNHDSPYRSPASSHMKPEVISKTGAIKRPAVLTAVSIITLVLGIFGSLGGCCGVVMLFAADASQAWMLDLMEGTSTQTEDGGPNVQVEAMQAGFDAQEPYMPATIAITTIGLFISLGMVFASITMLRNNPAGKKQLVIVLFLCIPSNLIAMGITVASAGAGYQAQIEVFEERGDSFSAAQTQTTAVLQPIVSIVFSLGTCIGYLAMYLYLVRSIKTHEFIESLRSQSVF